MDVSKYYPTLIRSYPQEGDTSVPVLPDIELEFSIDLDPAILTTSVINNYLILVRQDNDQPVSLTLVSPPNPVRARTIVLRPSTPLERNTKYLLTILPDLPAFTGRKAGVRRSISFTTISASAQVGTPLPQQPSDQSAVPKPITLQWAAVTLLPGGTTAQYLVEVSDTREFLSVLWSSSGTATSVQIPNSILQEDTAYYWRVRAHAIDASSNEVGVSDWSSVRSFVVNTYSADDLYISPPSVEIVCSLDTEPPMYDTKQWPSLWMYGVPDVSNVIASMDKRSVDGYPSWSWFSVPINVTYDVNGAKLSILPTVDPEPNMIYKIQLILGSNVIYSRSFYSWFRPMYCHPDTVRMLVGSAVSDQDYITDEEIAFIIYRKSMEANRHYIRWYGPIGFGGPQEATVRGIECGQYYAVQKWVELQSAIEVLSRWIMRISEGVGTNRRLGDYSESNDPNAIHALLALRKQLQKESYTWLAEFSKIRSVSIPTSKSSYRPIEMRGYDLGTRHIPSRDWGRE